MSFAPGGNYFQTLLGDGIFETPGRDTEGIIIVIMQRLHEADLVGYLLEQEGWYHLNLPAIADESQEVDISDTHYHPRAAGDPLHQSGNPWKTC